MKAELAHLTAVHHPSPTGLTIFWLEILELAHQGSDLAVAERLGRLALRREDLEDLFGASAASKLWSEYGRAFASFAGAGAREIAQKIRERRYDDVEVVPQTICFEAPRLSLVTQAGGGALQTGASSERVGEGPLRTNAQVFSVRLKRSDETDGIRIDTFVYIDGVWRTALKIGRNGK